MFPCQQCARRSHLFGPCSIPFCQLIKVLSGDYYVIALIDKSKLPLDPGHVPADHYVGHYVCIER